MISNSIARARPRVLLVAEFQPLVRALRSLLEEEGYEVGVVEPNRAAESSVANYGLVIVDARRPEDPVVSRVWGWCRVTSPQPTPVLVLCSPAAPGEPAPAFENRLSKPFELDTLLARVRAAVSQPFDLRSVKERSGT